MEYLYDKLIEYSLSDYYAYHMPGHKRNPSLTGAELPYNIDITEIEGFDDLHHAKGILREAQKRAASVYQAEESCYLINGSTVGLLSAVMGCTKQGDTVLMARNCHKSVYNAVFLNCLHPVYIYPEKVRGSEMNGEIRPEQVDALLNEYPDIRAVIITSPTYDGVMSDVAEIAKIVHEKNIPLILDEAHGAHLGFYSYFPANGNQCGADLVIHSLHKTLPSLTQTALLHMNGSIADRSSVRKYLGILQSSSPSYVLMSAMDECVRMLAERGETVFSEYAARLDFIRKKLRELQHMQLLETDRYDPSKLVISVKNTETVGTEKIFTGMDLYRCLLEEYHIQAEMAAGSYVVLITSPADSQEGFVRLFCALREIDERLQFKPQRNTSVSSERTEERENRQEWLSDKENAEGKNRNLCTEVVFLPWEAELRREEGAESVVWESAVGRIALEYTYLYPPGIPLTVPGERISGQVVNQIRMYGKMGFNIEGTEKKGQIKVLLYE